MVSSEDATLLRQVSLNSSFAHMGNAGSCHRSLSATRLQQKVSCLINCPANSGAAERLAESVTRCLV